VNALVKIIWALKNFFSETPIAEGLRPTLWWIFRGSPLYLRLLALMLVVVSLCLGSLVWLDLSDTNNILVSALVSPWENAQQGHTGIASFLLSSVVEKQNEPDSPVVTSNFLSLVSAVEARLGNWVIPNGRRRAIAIQVVKSPSYGNDVATQLFLSDRDNGFLFVPGITLTHPKVLETKVAEVGASDHATAALTQDEEPRLFDDIEMSQAVSDQICGQLETLNETSPVETTIFTQNNEPRYLSAHFSQAYLIFGSGVTRLCEANMSPGWQEQRKYYKEQFTSSTLLEDRPYFAETLADRNIASALSDAPSPKSLSEVFHRTEPYIDLGGNGVVETFCRRMAIKATLEENAQNARGSNNLTNIIKARYPYVSDAIFCVDFRLQKNIQDTLLTKIRRFGGFSAEFTCDVNTGCVQDLQQSSVNNVPIKYRLLAWFFPPLAFDGDDTQNLSDKFRSLAAKNEQSQITGRISVAYPRTTDGPVVFTVPLGSSRILAGKLDLHRYQELSSWWSSLFAISTAAAVVVLILILADYGLKFKEQERAFEAVDTVMRDVPAAYARLNTDGKFLKVNDALAKQLGFESAQTAMPILRNQAYQDFIIEDDRKVYLDIREERKNGKPYRSYTVSLWTGGAPGKPPAARFEVHGWDVPTPRISKDKPGQSFGILLPAGAPKVVPIGEVRSATG